MNSLSASQLEFPSLRNSFPIYVSITSLAEVDTMFWEYYTLLKLPFNCFADFHGSPSYLVNVCMYAIVNTRWNALTIPTIVFILWKCQTNILSAQGLRQLITS